MAEPNADEVAAFLERISARLRRLAEDVLGESEAKERSAQSSCRTQDGGSLAGKDSSEASSTGS
jgi:hypothetical protein